MKRSQVSAVPSCMHSVRAESGGRLALSIRRESIDVTTVSDPVSAEKVMGESVAFKYTGDKVMICSPANGVMNAAFPTGHAFGIATKNGVELLVHIGINTVEANGEGFQMLKNQNDPVKAGDPICGAFRSKKRTGRTQSII